MPAANTFAESKPQRGYVIVYSDRAYYYMPWSLHLRYEALYGESPSGRWLYPEQVPIDQRVYGIKTA